MKIDVLFVEDEDLNGIGSTLEKAPYNGYDWTIGLEGNPYANDPIDKDTTLIGISIQ